MAVDLTDYFERPRRRLFKWRANERAGREGNHSAGAFNGVCTVFEGDEFFMELAPIEKVHQDGSPRAKGGQMPKLPTWADPIEEFEPPQNAPLKAIKKPEPAPGRKLTAASAE